MNWVFIQIKLKEKQSPREISGKISFDLQEVRTVLLNTSCSSNIFCVSSFLLLKCHNEW